ncbi:MAG: hypothetical protein ACJ716_06090 [Marmoricola sp.]
MTDFEREEAAFRGAFARHTEEDDVVSFHPPRRDRRAPLLVAALVLAVVGTAVAVAGSRGHEPDAPPADGATLKDAQWIGIRNIEVKAPVGWEPKYEPGRPDCIQKSTDDPAVPGFVKQGYVVIGDPGFMVTLQGCLRPKGTDDPDPGFGELPFPLWRPYVKVVNIGGDPDGTWEFRGWRLTRKTFGDVQVSVLSAPGDDGLGAAVLASVRRVTVNHLGCAVDSPVLDRPALDGSPLPRAGAVSGVVICEYRRYPQGPGLGGSRTLSADAAKALVRAVHDAPDGFGPDRPSNCLHSPPDRALALRFLGLDGKAVSEAYAYFDSCVGNGIVTPSGTHRLTRGDCAPLFADAPIALPSAQESVSNACYDRDGSDDFLTSPARSR